MPSPVGPRDVAARQPRRTYTAAVGTLQDLRLPDALKSAFEGDGWTCESLTPHQMPSWTRWDGLLGRGEASAVIRLWDLDPGVSDAREGVRNAIDGDHWARREDGNRVLAVAALNGGQAREHLDDLLEVIASGATNKRGLKRWMDTLGLSAVEIATTDQDGVHELSAVGTLGPLRMTATTRRPSARAAPPSQWTRTLTSGSAFATAGPWVVSTSVYSHGAAASIIAAALGAES